MADSSLHFALEPVDNARLANLCGVHDTNMKELGKMLNVRIQHRGEHFRISGSNGSALRAQKMIRELYVEAENGVEPEKFQQLVSQGIDETSQAGNKLIVAGVRSRSKTQSHYLETINSHDVTFGIGASGTGKTFLAMACALQALKNGEVRRIVLVRPAVEAGESLGFLPGDPVQKVNPYLRPLQDALSEITSGKQFDELIRNDSIEMAPLAFMRGRTLSSCFVILDEAQNTTRAQMLMFLTRLGIGSRCVVTGDESQIDLSRPKESGLFDILNRVKDISGCAVVRFQHSDTMRHPVVERILRAYEND